MRDDLLDAKAAVDWAESQFDTLKARLIAWREIPPYRVREELHPESGKKVLRLCDVKQLPLIVNAEVGAIINSIRSSLDILVTSVAARSTHIAPKDAYFPVASDRSAFSRGDYKGSKVIQGLPKSDQTVIESLEPWRGGNDLLVALHDLDILRKHRRLVTVRPVPFHVAIVSGTGGKGHISFAPVWSGFEENAFLAETDINRQNNDIHLGIEPTLSDGGAVAREHLITALTNFAGLANSIINLFN